MANLLPELDVNPETLSLIVKELSKAFPGIKISEIRIIGQQHQWMPVNNAAQLFSLLAIRPAGKRSGVELCFEYSRKKNGPLRNRGVIHFGVYPQNSFIEINGGTSATQSEDAQKLVSAVSVFERKISNNLGRTVLPTLICIFLIAFNLARPSTIFSDSQISSLITAAAPLPFIIGFINRPHVFFYRGLFSYLQLIFNPKIIITTCVAAASFVGIAIYAPLLLNMDQRKVAATPALQVEVLRRLLTPELLNNFKELSEANALYDSANSAKQKSLAARSIAIAATKLISTKNGLSSAPIGKLPLFSSTARSFEPGNYLQDALLVHIKINTAAPPAARMLYQAHALSNDFPTRHFIGLEQWLREPVIKDKFGQMWTRADLVSNAKDEAEGKLQGARLNNFLRLREFPEDKVEFRDGDNIPLIPQNEITDESLRAIGQELVESSNIIQQTLSSNPSK